MVGFAKHFLSRCLPVQINRDKRIQYIRNPGGHSRAEVAVDGEGRCDGGEEDVGEEACQRLDDVDRVDDPVKADDEAERDGNAAQRVDEDVEPRVLVDVQVILDAAVDELVEHDADRQRCCEDADRDEEHLHQVCPVNPGQPIIRQENNLL